MNFKRWIENELPIIAYRYIHRDGSGLMNNSSLNYDRLTDNEYDKVQTGYLGLQQPPNFLHSQNVLFAFTQEGEKKHKQLIKLLSKISKTGVIRQKLNLTDYDIIWQNDDGQLALVKKTQQ